MANRFWIGPAGGNNNWSNINNWSLTDGGATVGAIPTASDAVQFTSTTNTDCTLDTAVAKVALTLTIGSGYTHTLTFNVNLSVSGSITVSSSAWTMTGSSTLRMIAAGTWTTNGKTIPISVEIGGTTLFTCTLAGALTVNILTLTNTTSTTFSGAFDITTTSNAQIQGTQTVTLTGNLICGATMFIADANVVNGAFEMRCITLSVSGALTGTTTVRFTGSGGLWSGSAAVSNSVIFDPGISGFGLSGTVLFAASGTPTLTATGVAVQGSGTLSIASACTIIGGDWTAGTTLSITAAITLTLNTSVAIFNTINFPNANVTLAGNVGITGWTWQNTTIAASAKTITLTQGNTYTCVFAMDLTGATATLTLSLVSSSATLQTIFTVGSQATQDVAFMVATRIDSSLGQTVFDFRGTLNTATNWSTSLPVNVLAGSPTVVLASSV